MVTCMLIQRKPAVTSHWILWEERGGVHMIILKIVSVCSLQVCAIPHIWPVFRKVCQHVWRQPVLTDILQAFSLTCIPQRGSPSATCKTESLFCHWSCFSVVLHDLWNRGVHANAMCLYTRPNEGSVCSAIYTIPTCPKATPFPWLVSSCLTNTIHKANQSNCPNNKNGTQ